MLGISWILTDIDITGHKYWTNYTWRLPATKPYSVWTKNTSTPGIDSAANNMTIECVQKWEMAPNLWSSATINHHKPWLEGTVFSKYLSTNYFHSSGYIKCSWKHKTIWSRCPVYQKSGACFFLQTESSSPSFTIRWVKIVRPWDTQRWHVSWHVSKPHQRRVFHQDMADRSKQLRRSLRGISRHTWKYQRHRSMVEDNCRAIA